MSQQELVRRVTGTLDAAGIEYMVTGALVSSLQGEPRTKHDIDIVIAIQESQASKLVEAYPPQEFYLEQDSIIDAIRSRGMFNLIDVKEGEKVDFRVLTDEPFDRSRFSRRYEEEVLGTRLYMSSAEDTILVKLKWAKLAGGSEKQITDALRVFEVQFKNLDMDYLKHWIKELDIEKLWDRLREEASPV